MIKSFTDHAANERTYLAWIRTALALMAFGFILGKFDLFLDMLSKNAPQLASPHVSAFPEILEGSLFLLSVLMSIGATARFLSYERAIDSEESKPYSGTVANLVLGLLVAALCSFALIYMVRRDLL